MSTPLSSPPDDPDRAGIGGERGGRGVRVGRLRVVDPRDAARDLDHLDAVRIEAEAAQSVADRRRRDLERPGQRARGEDVRHHVRRGEPVPGELGDRGQLEGARAAIVEEGAVHEDAVHDAQVARPGNAEVEADRAGALDRPRRPRPSRGSRHPPCCRRTRRGCDRRRAPSRRGRPRTSRATRGGRRRG